MSLQGLERQSHVRHDGFGSRYSSQDGQFGPVEVLELSSALATPGAEQAIRTCAARQAEANPHVVSRVVRIARRGETLSITATATDGVSLADLLSALEFGTVSLGDEAVLELGANLVAAVATLHQMSRSPAHGAINPGHLIVRADASVLLTGAVFGDALEALQWNREQLWRIFNVALPPSATLPRFDQRADVTQLGAVILATLLRRTLTASEYPKGMLDLVDAAVSALAVSARCRSALRMWLQQTLQLHPKSLFASAADAAKAYGDVVADVNGRRAALQQLQSAVRQLSGGAAAERPAAAVAPVPAVECPAPAPARTETTPAPNPRRGMPFLRNVFPALWAN